MRSGRVMDRGYLGDGSGHTKPSSSTVVMLPEECAGYVIIDRLDRLAVTIVAMNPGSL